MGGSLRGYLSRRLIRRSAKGLPPVWQVAQDAGLPIVLHVGGGGRLLDPGYFENGLPPVADFHGGDHLGPALRSPRPAAADAVADRAVDVRGPFARDDRDQPAPARFAVVGAFGLV